MSCRASWLVVFLVAGMLALGACTRRVCPAYASAFILDDSIRNEMFALFGPDSLPLPPPRVKKNANGLIVRVSNRKIARRQHIIPARKVYPPPPEDTTQQQEPIQPALSSDSLAPSPFPRPETITDSTAIATLDTDPSGADPSGADPSGADPSGADPSETDLSDTDQESAVEDSTMVTYRFGYDPSDNFNQEQIFYNRRYGHLFIEGEETIAADSIVQDSIEAEFEDIPDAYVEGSFVEEEEDATATDPGFPDENEPNEENNAALRDEDEEEPTEAPAEDAPERN